MSKIKIGVIGAGHLGKIHLRILKDLPEYELLGFYDQSAQQAAAVAAELGLKAWSSLEELVQAADALDVVTPTLSHFDIGNYVIRQSKDIFIEKPIANTVEEARRLVALAKEAGVVAQVGHVERFNPCMLAMKDQPMNPMFIEGHRLAQWNPRGTDVSVVLDLMIHDIDIVLHLVQSTVKRISASGVAVITDTPDIANARIEFHNGAVANLTASRISVKNMRKMRMFQQHAYVSLDFLERKTEIYQIGDQPAQSGIPFAFEVKGATRYLQVSHPPVPEANAIQEELKHFAVAIHTRQQPPVSFHDGYRALDVAHQILEKINPFPA
ncbi:MAG: Gfo/Idh/MocA family oxidoreductase [Bacteroidetes bacterium]|jgi:predicted dehydrogenase|nr:Gfo/Idh/MocA family oxidoreductase [Bacteroidota bacterium]